MEKYITKKELLKKTDISYGQLYRWKRQGIIPEEWFIKKSSITGQETVLPMEKAIERIYEIKTLMKDFSLEEIAEKYSINLKKEVIPFENLYSSPYLQNEYVNAVGNYFKKSGYTMIEYMVIICCAEVSRKEHYTIRQYVDLLRYALPLADKTEKLESRCIIFAAGGDCHIRITNLESNIIFDSGLRIYGDYNLEDMWNKVKETL